MSACRPPECVRNPSPPPVDRRTPLLSGSLELLATRADQAFDSAALKVRGRRIDRSSLKAEWWRERALSYSTGRRQDLVSQYRQGVKILVSVPRLVGEQLGGHGELDANVPFIQHNAENWTSACLAVRDVVHYP